MTELDDELAGLDPVGLMDEEAARIEQYYAGLSAAELVRPSRCEGWTVRDVLAHLAASEDYHHACLAGTVSEFLRELGERGATDVASFNALGIADLEGVPADELLRRWRAANAETRQGFRERGAGVVDTSIGAYPSRWQAFHLAGELATHADDAFVPVDEVDREARRWWLVRFSRFALRESKAELAVEASSTGTRVVSGEIDLELTDDDLIAAVAGRADPSGLDARVRSLLSTMP